MIRHFVDTSNLKLNVVMKDGREFSGCDISERPQGQYETVVSFWWGDVLRAVPLNDVFHFEYYEEASE